MNRKMIREKGKVRLSEYFKELKAGDYVAIVKVPGNRANLPDRMQGKTGIVEAKRGKAYIVKIKDINQEKRYIIKPVNLKRIKS